MVEDKWIWRRLLLQVLKRDLDLGADLEQATWVARRLQEYFSVVEARTFLQDLGLEHQDIEEITAERKGG